MNHLSNIVLLIAFGLLGLTMISCFIRIILGPSLPDRVIALDLTVNALIASTAIFSITSQQYIYMDVVIALALIVFLGTVAFARYIEWQNKENS